VHEKWRQTMGKSATPYWLHKNMRKTIGGQLVGFKPLYCESFGGSDYCRHCSRDMCTATGRPNICYVLERIRLGFIPDKEVAAFGCDLESNCVHDHPHDVLRCEKWCHQSECTFALIGSD